MNEPLPTCYKNPHFLNEAKCCRDNLSCENKFYLHENDKLFPIKGWALNLVLVQRPGETRKARYISCYRRTVWSILLIKTFLGLVEMMFGPVNVSFSLPEWQAAKMTFFAPWFLTSLKGPLYVWCKRSSSDNYNYTHSNLEIVCSELSSIM